MGCNQKPGEYDHMMSEAHVSDVALKKSIS
jgi:hypothetical protein